MFKRREQSFINTKLITSCWNKHFHCLALLCRNWSNCKTGFIFYYCVII